MCSLNRGKGGGGGVKWHSYLASNAQEQWHVNVDSACLVA